MNINDLTIIEDTKNPITVAIGKKTFKALAAFRSGITLGGILRETLCFQISVEDFTLEDIQKIILEEDLSSIKTSMVVASEDKNVKNTTNSEIYVNYTIVSEFGVKLIGYNPNVLNEGKQYIVLELAAKTPQEIQQEKILAQLKAMGIEI